VVFTGRIWETNQQTRYGISSVCNVRKVVIKLLQSQVDVWRSIIGPNYTRQTAEFNVERFRHFIADRLPLGYSYIAAGHVSSLQKNYVINTATRQLQRFLLNRSR